MIVIIDYGTGNLGSIANMFKKIGVSAVVSSAPDEINRAERLVLPGVGSFDNGMTNIRERGLLDILTTKVVENRTPLLGICLGMQLLTHRSEEGSLPGLGCIDAEAIRFAFPASSQQLKIPHMGWNSVEQVNVDCLFKGMPVADLRFYFVHSYHVVCRSDQHVIARAQYGIPFCAAVRDRNIMGVQFHPEKSHRFGMKLLRNFIEFKPC